MSVTSITAPRRISASSVKTLTDCALSYYYSRVLKVVERTWSRTVIGSLAHSIFECLRNPRHRHHFDAITVSGNSVDYTLSPALRRLVYAWQLKHQIAQELIDDLNGILYVGLLCIDFHWVNADKDENGKPKVYGPEHAFKLVLDDGTEIKGFIDDMAIVGGVAVIRDFKSQRKLFQQSELPNNIQALIYSLYVWQTFGIPSMVQFVMLRHPPTKRTPQKHIQTVYSPSPAHFDGLVAYLKDSYRRINALTLEEATLHPHCDEGFCQRVCSFLEPKDYWALTPADSPETILSTFPLDNPPQVLQDGTVLVRKHHPGCAARGQSSLSAITNRPL